MVDTPPIGMGSVDALGNYSVMVAPPLTAGERIFAYDRCNMLAGLPVTVGVATPAPALSLPMVFALASALGLIGLLALRRGATN